jgi:hypothetical protein
LVKFVLANSEVEPGALADWTIPQINAKAESIRKYKIHAFGVGLGGKEDADRSTGKTSNLNDVANQWNMAFAGF